MGDIGLLLWGDKELCFGYAVYIGFTNGEYRIVIVDFIAPCGGHQRTGKKDSEEPFLPILRTPTL